MARESRLGEKVRPSTQTPTLRLPGHVLDRIKAKANAKVIAYQALIKIWLSQMTAVEKLIRRSEAKQGQTRFIPHYSDFLATSLAAESTSLGNSLPHSMTGGGWLEIINLGKAAILTASLDGNGTVLGSR